MRNRRDFLQVGGIMLAGSALTASAKPAGGENPCAEGYRTEKDTMGVVCVPAEMHFGAGTQRAVENFPISGMRFPRRFIRALGLIKGSAAQVNKELGLLKPDHADAIVTAAREVAEGKWD